MKLEVVKVQSNIQTHNINYNKFIRDIESIFYTRGLNINASLTNETWDNKKVIALAGEFSKNDLHKYLITMTIIGKMALDNNFLIEASPVFDKDSNTLKFISLKFDQKQYQRRRL